MNAHKMGLMALAGAMVVGMTATASAQSMRMRDDGMTGDRGSMRMERMERTETRTMRAPRTTGSIREERGASYYAPGQVKKRMGAKSARDFAPGRMMMNDDDDVVVERSERRMRMR